MKRFFRFLALLCACVVVPFTLSGCGMSEGDAKEYVQAALDAGYKGEFEKYIEITGSSEEEAQKLYDDNINMLLESVGFGTMVSSDELEEKYRELFKQIFALEKYTVGDAEKTEDGFEVLVSVQKLSIFSDISAELEEKLEEEVAKLGEDASEAEINELALETMYDMLQEKVENPAYGEKDTVTIHISQDDEGVWNISQEDLEALDQTLVE